ncbi:MAG: LysR family transcriptional regulator [Gammaproteobacteria bacterium]|nr:LysR family transcriptional regulator [Gammaproteobacteria bacterium]
MNTAAAAVSTRLTTQVPLLELDLLRTLVAIAETGNFSAAAESVYRTPSAVSMQVKKIEEIVGRPVFVRDSRSVSVTPEGELLLEHGRRMLSLNDQLIAQFMAPTVAGVVRMGATDDIAERSLPELLRRFSRTHCCVTVDVVVDTSVNLRQRVRKGDLDLALVTCSPEKKLSAGMEIVFQERLVWAGAKNGVAHEKNPLPISVWEEGCSWRDAALDGLESIGRDYRIAFMSAHISGQRAAILADLAVAPIPCSCCTNGIVDLSSLTSLPPLSDYAIAMVTRKKPNAATAAAAQHLRESLMVE